MILHGYAWEGGDDGSLSKVEISVERTDQDEVALFARDDDHEVTAIYVSVDTAVRLGTMFGIAALAHEIQAPKFYAYQDARAKTRCPDVG